MTAIIEHGKPGHQTWLCSTCYQEDLRADDVPRAAGLTSIDLKPRDEWGWDACGVCGSPAVASRGIIVMISGRGGFYAGRMGWCNNDECQVDFRGTGACTFNKVDSITFDKAFE